MGSIDTPEGIEITVDRATTDELPFYCVPPMKFSLLSVVTFGLYELFWFYKNWTLVRARSGRDISPFWRAFFSPLFCHPFAVTVNSAAESVNLTRRIRPAPIALGYAGLVFLQRLPDPYWLICLLSFAPLLPIVWQISEVHGAIRPGFESAIGWNRGSYAALAVGGLVSSLAVLAVFGPPTRALRHSEIPSSYEAALVEAGVLEAGEEIQFFYSSGFFSILEEGNLITQTRVVSYETVEGELFLASSTYPEVLELNVKYSEGVLEDTVITVSTRNGEEFFLIVSAEDGRDKEFVSDLERRLARVP